ncbi:hypothetical protein [Streptomyces sp. URMC 129]|uniref:hypothetical protein n=1 Tax=Streptomyces sp. URMC 129 TaxID=3423407 RepID=UPI003F1D374F
MAAARAGLSVSGCAASPPSRERLVRHARDDMRGQAFGPVPARGPAPLPGAAHRVGRAMATTAVLSLLVTALPRRAPRRSGRPAIQARHPGPS